MNIKYNQPIEVTKEQYDLLMKECAGMIAGRYDYESGKYYIKVWLMSCSDFVSTVISKSEPKQPPK